MEVHTAIMLDEEVADHNCPTVLVASSEEGQVKKVHDHIRGHSSWRETVGRTEDELQLLSIDDINLILCDYDAQRMLQREPVHPHGSPHHLKCNRRAT